MKRVLLAAAIAFSVVTVHAETEYYVTLKFTPATGVVSGKFNLPYKDTTGADKTLSANYAGVIIIGYGPGCGCGREVPSVTLPFMNGAFYIGDKMTVNNGKKDVQINIKRGGAAVIDQAN